MGGFYMLSNEPEYIIRQPGLFSLDLKNDFSVEGHLSSGFVRNTSVSTTPYEGSGVFWGDLNQTYLYTMSGADDPNAPGQSTLQGYDTAGKDWQSISVSGESLNKYDRLWSMHASSFEGGGSTSYIAGGHDYVSGMVIYNSSDPLHPSWTNATDKPTPYFHGCTTQYVRFGDAGVLVSVGGFVTESTSVEVAQRREMNSIQVYDIAGEEWSNVFATGDIPPSRSRACSSLSAAPDDSSFQMIIHGGWDEENALRDVYVLTMPTFHWIKVNTTNGDITSDPRMDHFCSSYQDRSMLVVGGTSQLGPNASQISCSDGYSAVRLLDTTTFQWQDQYPLPDTKYQVPQAVIDVVGGNSNGGAKPASAFSDTLGSNLAVFSKTIPRYDPDHPPQPKPHTTSSATATPSPSPLPPPPPPPSRHTNPSTVAGAAIGGILGAAALLSPIVWFLFRRRRRQNPPQQRQWQEPEQLLAELRYSTLHEMKGDSLPAEL